MSAIALFLQQFFIHAIYCHTEKEGYEIFVGPFLTNLLEGHDIILAVGLADNDYRMTSPHQNKIGHQSS